ncbi:MAG: hypothetical protein J5I93_05165 [Pirellulaceae bacterium]|nr:hypothetical protein [Pirellulaceae bacterium]
MAKKVFLSRATAEFRELTDSIRRTGSAAYGMLQLHDQEHPPVVSTGGGASLTVSKVYEWIRLSHHVLHYVGEHPGGCAKVPPNEISGMAAFIDPRSQEVLASLLSEFDRQGVPRSELTYTQLEGVIAIALERDPLVFLWEAGEQDSAEPDTDARRSQRAYCAWLRSSYLPGRDRIVSTVRSDFGPATHRVLGELNTRTALERLAKSVAEVPIWEMIFALSQPDSTDEDIEKQSQKVRQLEFPLDVDWIDGQPTTCGALRAGAWVRRGLASTPADAAAHWLIPLHAEQDGLGLLTHGAGQTAYRTFPITAASLRATCFVDGAFWVLTEESGAYQLQNLGAAHGASLYCVSGFQTNSFEAIDLTHANGTFYLACGGDHWRLQPGDAQSFEPIPCDPPDAASSSVLPQFPERAAFPFRRYFAGETLETSLHDPKWALVKTDGNISLIALRGGSFADAFRTVDLLLEGEWEAHELRSDVAVVWLMIRNSATQDEHAIPFFGCDSQQACWQKRNSNLPLLRQRAAASQLFEVGPANAARFEPFCFLERTIDGGDATRKVTRFRVWLIPTGFDRELIRHLRGFLCDLVPLPGSPVTKVPARLPHEADDQWWRLLWQRAR